MTIIFLVMISYQWPLINLNALNNLVLMAITLTPFYVCFCLLFQDAVARASFDFLFRSTYVQEESCWTII